MKKNSPARSCLPAAGLRPPHGLLRRLALCVPGTREAGLLLRELNQLTHHAAQAAVQYAKRTHRPD